MRNLLKTMLVAFFVWGAAASIHAQDTLVAQFGSPWGSDDPVLVTIRTTNDDANYHVIVNAGGTPGYPRQYLVLNFSPTDAAGLGESLIMLGYDATTTSTFYDLVDTYYDGSGPDGSGY